jgi:hypothetical protein|tara:strand:- start:1209 stop:1871 length:663 start_codon:yes stop_codon:yes gene_type:complete
MKKLLLLFLIISTACSSDDDAVNNNNIDTIAPVVTLVGDNPQTILQGDNYTELGIVSVDNINGDISNNVEITINVDLLKLGNYTVTYKSVDTSNNTTIIIRDVIIDDPIIGSWTLVKEEWVGPGDWPSGQARGCFMSSDAGSPDTFLFTETSVTKNVWECFQNGDLATDIIVFGPVNYTNLSPGSYDIDSGNFQATFLEDFTEMQTPFEDGNITQTWSKD